MSSRIGACSWAVPASRSIATRFRHLGVGFDHAIRNMDHGLIHASWALGTAVVSTVCIQGLNPETDFFPAFRNYNRNVKEPLVEIPYGAATLPDVFAHRKLGAFQTEPFFMFYTEEPVSPIAGEMKTTYELMRALASAYGSGESLSIRRGAVR